MTHAAGGESAPFVLQTSGNSQPTSLNAALGVPTGSRLRETPLPGEELWQLTFDSVPDLIAVLDLDHRIVRINRAMAERLGRDSKECIGQICFRCVHGSDQPPGNCPHARTIVDGLEHVAEICEGRLGGDFLVSTTPVRNSDGEVIGSVHVARDITRQKQTEKALREAKDQLARTNLELEKRVEERTARLEEMVAELETFSYSMVHDMRAPLRSMQGMASLLLEEYSSALDNQGRDYLRRIKAAAERQDRLIREVLQYSQTVRQSPDLAPINLDELVKTVIREYPALNEREAEIEVQAPLDAVLGHEPSLIQCLSNLIGNALKFVVPGRPPKIRIRSEQRSGKVRVWIEDNGIGISPEGQAHLFRLFSRLHTQSEFEGAGIGLAVVRKAIERMGGEVGVESVVGEGSRFWFEVASA